MSIKDVAEKAGVSVATVSRVLNGRATVRPEIARRVRAVMAELNYEPRAVRPGRKPQPNEPHKGTGVIGIVIWGRGDEHLRHPSVNAMFMGIASESQRIGLQQQIIPVPDIDVMPQAVREQRVDGLIVLPVVSPLGQNAVDQFHPLPCVQVGGPPANLPATDHVTPDHQRAGLIAADYLHSKGCRCLAFLNHAPLHRSFLVEQKTFRERLAEQGMEAKYYLSPTPENEDDSWQPLHIRNTIAELLDQLLTEIPDVDGIFLPTDQQSATCHALLKERGLNPGTDIFLVSCNNDEPWLMTMDPRPATIDMRWEELGREAVRRLSTRLQTPMTAPMVIRPIPVLIEPQTDERGESC